MHKLDVGLIIVLLLASLVAGISLYTMTTTPIVGFEVERPINEP